MQLEHLGVTQFSEVQMDSFVARNNAIIEKVVA